MSEVKNGTIKRVIVEREDHGILTMSIQLEGDGWGVGFGGYALDGYDERLKRRTGCALLSNALLALFDTFGVDSLDELTGLPCRVDSEGWGGRCLRIGHFTKDKWFSWKELAEAEVGARREP